MIIKLEKTCEIFNFCDNEWTLLKDMNYSRENSGIKFWKERQKVITFGGWVSPTTIEEYDFHKNEWYLLPEFNEEHTFQPLLTIHNNCVLCVVGNMSNTSDDLGFIEMLDTRENIKQWEIIQPAKNLFPFSHNSSNNVVVRFLPFQ